MMIVLQCQDGYQYIPPPELVQLTFPTEQQTGVINRFESSQPQSSQSQSSQSQSSQPQSSRPQSSQPQSVEGDVTHADSADPIAWLQQSIPG